MAQPPVSVLSDGTILELVERGRIRIDPWDPRLVQPASVDLRLGDSFRVFHNHRASAIDLRDPPSGLTEEVVVPREESFVIHPGEFCLGRTLEWVELPDDVVARIEGKALALDTEVPTPRGWRTIEDLLPGDEVFLPSGAPVRVRAVTGPMLGHECRKVRFSDGAEIVADAQHQWVVTTRYTRRYRLDARVVRTQEMEGQLGDGQNGFNFRTEQALPVQYPARELPVDPYVLGTWIGDGTRTKAEITTIDQPILEQIAAAGFAVRPALGPLPYRIGGVGHTRDRATARTIANESLNGTLRLMGLFEGKRIPEAYMTASVEQRHALLAGLMDTDGYVDELGRCEITTNDPRLAVQYRELIASLGFRPVIAVKPARLYGKDCGLRHEVTFTPHQQVFRLPRKAVRLRLTQRFDYGRTIHATERVRSVPVKCIEVDDRCGQFLVTRSFIPTHNSSLGRLGLIVHATAGFCDPGWKGTLTLELNNLTRVPIKLYPGLPIAQLSFMALDQPALRPYGSPELGSHYQGQRAATESRYEGLTGKPNDRGPTRIG